MVTPLASRVRASAQALGPGNGVWRELLMGSVGSFHLLRLAGDALNQAKDAAALTLGRTLLAAAWEDDPLNAELARQLVLLDAKLPKQHGTLEDQLLAGGLAPSQIPLLTTLSKQGVKPEDTRYYERLAQRMDPAKLSHFLSRQLAKEPGQAYWLSQALAVAQLFGELNWFEALLAALPEEHWGTGSPLAPLTTYLRAQTRFLMGDLSTARELLEPAFGEELTSFLAPVTLLAECRFRQGDTDGARTLWRRALTLRPWQTSLLRHATDALTGRGTPVAEVPGTTAVLLYSYNKRDELEATLSSLAEGEQTFHRLFVLDNGSTDGSPEMLRGWRERFGEGMQLLELPVNVGAPAARNWLLSLEEVRACEYAVYLDDDVALPGDWLRGLFASVAADPEAKVHGVKILDHAVPHIIQSADLHLVLGAEGEEELAALYDPRQHTLSPFNVSDLHGQVPDTGIFDAVTPCISVTGCCHLFKTTDLLEAGEFDIRLSPSQYDDLEHDLRMAKSGHHASYNGFTAVRHFKRTGKGVAMAPSSYGSGLANKYKLHALYPARTMLALHKAEGELLAREVETRLTTLDDVLGDDVPAP